MRPDEGWVSLPLVLVLAGTMAWSISDARWILGRDELTSFLIWVALAAALWGYLSARLDLSPWLAQALGCIIGAFVLIEAVGASLPDATPGLAGWFHATANSVAQAYLDLTWRHLASTLQVGHFCLLLGILVWGTAQAASYDIFGYHRAVNGVLLLAVVLIANMALTNQDQLGGLVIFSAAALVLLLLAHAADERANWLRHRIWRGRDFEAPHLQGGLAFARLAVAGSLILTTVASSAPLASTAQRLRSQRAGRPQWLERRYCRTVAASRNPAERRLRDRTRRSARSSTSPRTTSSPSGSPAARSPSTGGSSRTTRSRRRSLVDRVRIVPGPGGRRGNARRRNPGPGRGNTPGRSAVSVEVHVQDTSLKHLIVANETGQRERGRQANAGRRRSSRGQRGRG